MKEIDFIPEWYKANRQRKRRSVRQSTLMAVMFVVMMVWGFVVDGYIARVNAQVQEIRDAFEKGQTRVDEVVRLKGQIEQIRQKTKLLEKVSSRTKITAILSEISFLMNDDVVLSELTLEQEDIEPGMGKKSAAFGAVVQIGSGQGAKEDPVVPERPCRMVVTLNGIAAEPADAATLISHLEQSVYFDGVTLVFSRPKKMKEQDVTEFKIRFYVADYQMKE